MRHTRILKGLDTAAPPNPAEEALSPELIDS